MEPGSHRSVDDPLGLRLLLFTQAVDSRDPILAFGVQWLRALAPRVASIDVVSLRAGSADLPANVRVFSVGGERGLSRPRRTLRFYAILARLLRRTRHDACFVHMIPIFAVMASPLLKARHIPITLWYTHGAVTKVLRLAERVVDTVVTASHESFNAPADKLVVTGHGIDTSRFKALDNTAPCASGPLRLLVVGRVAPVKRLELVVEAVALLVEALGPAGIECRLVGPISERDRSYADSLDGIIRERGIARVVHWVGPLQPDDVVREYQQANVVANLTATGSFDKVVLEAMSCQVPVVTSNRAFERVLSPVDPRMSVPDADPPALAKAILALGALAPPERAALGQRLREVVERNHSLERLADLLVDVLSSSTHRRGRTRS